MSETSKSNISGPLRWGLAPLAGLYGGIMAFRNHLYNIGYRRSLTFEPLIISVGNLSVGGTGKSPMVEYLVRLISAHKPLAILSRGYKRKTRGVRIAGEEDTAATLGDEPFQFYRKFGQQSLASDHKVVVAVAERRGEAIPEILFVHPEVEVILLDDAFQHRSVQADFQLLLTTFQRPFYQDSVLPMGRLREYRKGAGRADAVVVTKCPEGLSAKEQENIRDRIRRYSRPEVPVFFSSIRYEAPQPVFEPSLQLREPLLLFSGLADSSLFEQQLKKHYEVKEHIRWEDHHTYAEADFEKVKAAQAASVLTTEKDMVKLLEPAQAKLWQQLPLFYLPIRTYFLTEGQQFDDLILRQLSSPIKDKNIE
ncbi:MAG: tetraacyldisaccharide 4'-kinase [Cyclobacteriaceae bacterium]